MEINSFKIMKHINCLLVEKIKKLQQYTKKKGRKNDFNSLVKRITQQQKERYSYMFT